jgi:hypothetical protein
MKIKITIEGADVKLALTPDSELEKLSAFRAATRVWCSGAARIKSGPLRTTSSPQSPRSLNRMWNRPQNSHR